MLEPVRRTSHAAQVFAQLRDQIVSGARAPGDPLPSERVLAETLGINRGAVREALHRLVQARLIAVRQGGASRVLDYRETAGIELLGALVVDADGAVNTDVVRSIMEMRTVLAPSIAFAAARRGGPALAEPLRTAIDDLAAARDGVERSCRSRVFWGALVDGSENIAYRLAYNSLNETTSKLDAVLGDVLSSELGAIGIYRALADCVAAGDADGARVRAAALVAIGERTIRRVLDILDAGGAAP